MTTQHNKPRVAVDFDGTCVRVTDLVCELINFRRGTRYTARDVTHWDFWRDNGPEQDFWDVYDMLDRTALRTALRPYDEHTTAVLGEIAERFGLCILTANDPKAEEGIAGWVKAHVPGAVARGFVVRCLGRVSSSDKAALPFDIYIDDSPRLAPHVDNVKRFNSWTELPALLDRAARWEGKTLLLANCRWNESVQDKGSAILV